MRKIRIGVLTISNSCAQGRRKDEGGPAIVKWARKKGWEVGRRGVAPDDRNEIIRHLLSWSDEDRLDVILTTGGTGIGPGDVTPESTRAVLEKEVCGIAEELRREGAKHTPFAAISRAATGVRGRTLIINLPGSPRSLEESSSLLESIIPHCIKMMSGAGHNHTYQEHQSSNVEIPDISRRTGKRRG